MKTCYVHDLVASSGSTKIGNRRHVKKPTKVKKKLKVAEVKVLHGRADASQVHVRPVSQPE